MQHSRLRSGAGRGACTRLTRLKCTKGSKLRASASLAAGLAATDDTGRSVTEKHFPCLRQRRDQRHVQTQAASASQRDGNTSSNALRVAVAYVITLAINYGSNVGIFFGNTNADVRLPI